MLCNFDICPDFHDDMEFLERWLSRQSDEELILHYRFLLYVEAAPDYCFSWDFPFDFSAYSIYVFHEMAKRYFKKIVSEEVF